jgi:hypothetical protein
VSLEESDASSVNARQLLVHRDSAHHFLFGVLKKENSGIKFFDVT